MRILTVVGARPQFVKAAAVSRAIARVAGITEVIVHTGQHFDPGMSAVFFEELAIPTPRHNLGIAGGAHGEMTGRMLCALEPVIVGESPDAVLVYGDTNSTLAGALVAAKLSIPIAHVEAGLRSFNRRMPEEVNRVLTDHVSRWLFCPTSTAVANLKSEGITTAVHRVGDVMYDATLFAAQAAATRSGILESIGVCQGEYGLATLHRAENTDDPVRLRQIIEWLQERADERPVVFPVHPRTRGALERSGLSAARFLLCDPVGYFDMTRLLQGAAAVYTDSGGVQKEAYFHRVPCVTLREETEWVETITHGWNRLWRGPDYAPRREIHEYGDGHAADAIVRLLIADA